MILELCSSYITPGEKELYEEFFGPVITKSGRNLPPYEEVIYNASMLLTNSDVSLGQPISVPPNSKPIGGYHIDPNVKPLPQVNIAYCLYLLELANTSNLDDERLQ